MKKNVFNLHCISPIMLDIECPANQEFRECDLDAKRDLSCDTPVLNVTGSLSVEGCFCPEGMIRMTGSSEECVLPKC